MTHDTPPKRITLEEAQAAVDPRLVAEILRDFGTNFDGVYPVGVLARGVGPEQSMIGLAIKRGHLVTRSHADALVAAALREAAKIAVRHWEGEEEDSLVMCEAILTLIPQPDAAAPDLARALLDARAELARVKADAAAAQALVGTLTGAAQRLNAACDAMWNDHRRVEAHRIKECHMKAISEAQQALFPALAQTPTDPGDGWTWNERLGWIGPDGKPADPRRRG